MNFPLLQGNRSQYSYVGSKGNWIGRKFHPEITKLTKDLDFRANKTERLREYKELMVNRRAGLLLNPALKQYDTAEPFEQYDARTEMTEMWIGSASRSLQSQTKGRPARSY
jgi:hypothetical protein